MSKVLMNGFTIHNVEECPKCGATEYAHMTRILNIIEICCDKCDYVAGGGIALRGDSDINRNREGFIKVTRELFNLWNSEVAKEKNQVPKKVRIINAKKQRI